MRKKVLIIFGFGVMLSIGFLIGRASHPVPVNAEPVAIQEHTPEQIFPVIEIGQEFRLAEFVPPRVVAGILSAGGYVRLETKSEIFQDFEVMLPTQYQVTYSAKPGRCAFKVV